MTIAGSLLAFLACLATAGADGGGPPSQTLDAQLREKLSPTLREWVTLEAEKLRRMASPEEAAVRADIRTRFQGQSLSTADQDRLAYLIFTEAFQAADRELNDYLTQLKANSGAAKPAPAASPGFQTGLNGLAPPVPDRTKGLVTRPGPSPYGSTSLGVGGVTVSPGSPGTVAGAARQVPAGTLEVNSAQALRLQTMINLRNQLVLVLNTLGKKVSPAPDSLLQQLK
jgi:hypothetical protein